MGACDAGEAASDDDSKRARCSRLQSVGWPGCVQAGEMLRINLRLCRIVVKFPSFPVF
jgi:hypothetical protein